MEFPKILYILLAVTQTASYANASCRVVDSDDECTYTVLCTERPASVRNPNCEGNGNVTFLVMQSENEYLNAVFFGSTNFDTRVQYIKAYNNSWEKIEDSALRYYSKAAFVDLSDNKIKSIGRTIFHNKRFLKVLNFSNNCINETLWMKTMFYSDDNYTPKLEVIDLSFNKITYLEKNILVQAPNLSEIYLNNNEIKSIHENAFDGGLNLVKLDLRHNKLMQLGQAFAKLRSVEYFFMSNNFLENIVNNEINEMVSLQYVNFSHNSIKTVHVSSFSRAIQMVSLDLSNNLLSDTIKNHMFINNGGLTNLNLYNNCISSIEDGIFETTSLKYLNLNMNKLTGIISTKLFAGLKKVSSLEITNQNLTKIDAGAFSDMQALTYCNLSSNIIQDVDVTGFLGANNLTILDISNNNIKTIDFIRQCLTSLEYLNLHNNDLSFIDSDSFINNPNVIKLDLSKNKIHLINALPLSKLQYLNLKGNMLNVTLKKRIFSPSKYLRSLDLSEFKIEQIESEVFVDMPTLAQLNLSHNCIELVDPNNFVNVNNMYSLDLSHNQLSNFSTNDSSALSFLKALYLNNNKLDTFVMVSNMSALIYLDLSNNYILNIANIRFTSLPILQVLLLSNNSLPYFNHACTDFVPLVTLDVSQNKISNVNISKFREIVSLNASFNKINIFNSSHLNNNYLQSLDMSGNQISDISPGTFQYVKILKFLSLAKNHLHTLHYGSFRGLHKTEVLDLSSNEISNLDVNIFHECTEMRKIYIDNNRLEYFDVEQLLVLLPKLYALSLGRNPLACKEIIHHIKNINRTTTRYVNVTSADKVFHEDNVNGIKCGVNADKMSDASNAADKSAREAVHSNWVVVLTVLSFLTIIVVGTIYLLKVYCKKKQIMYKPRRISSVYSSTCLE